ncbi:HlyD family type I secretion periplasmic adaptor subunit [Maritalea sp.]|uniref:HlyD family type I secretion periplasmic adaptor subunit n=1 Tax=Maritalea sp. TaxID=2003361 RepID=UPI003EF341D3
MNATPARKSIRRHLIIATLFTTILVGGFGTWAATAPLSGAVIAMGTVVVDSYAKPVQHPSGGIVAKINVTNGDLVEIGDVLLSLDSTITRTDLAIIETRLAKLRAQTARLQAERLGHTEIATGLEANSYNISQDAMAAEQSILAARLATRIGQRQQLEQRKQQLQKQLGGIHAQIKAKQKEISLIEEDLQHAKDLVEKEILSSRELREREREMATAEGQLGALDADAGKIGNQIAEVELQSLQIDSEFQRQVAEEEQEISSQVDELFEREVAAKDQLQRIDLRAPQSGVVHDLQVHNKGAVIASGQEVLQIIPITDELVAELKIQPQDIDQLTIGQIAELRFSSFDQGTTPIVNGQVIQIGADLSIDPQTGIPHYLVRIITSKIEMDKLGDLKLIPGMPVEAFIETTPRTAFSYATKPILDQLARAFKE